MEIILLSNSGGGSSGAMGMQRGVGEAWQASTSMPTGNLHVRSCKTDVTSMVLKLATPSNSHYVVKLQTVHTQYRKLQTVRTQHRNRMRVGAASLRSRRP